MESTWARPIWKLSSAHDTLFQKEHMMKEPTIENFLAFEREHKCSQIEVLGIPIWSLYRYEIHNAIKKHTVGRTEGAQTPFSKKELFAMALNAMKSFNYRNVDVLFACDGRRNKNISTGVYENIYFDEIAKKYNSVILEHPDNHTHLTPNGMDNVFFTDKVAFETNIAVKLSKKFNTNKRKKYTEEIQRNFRDIFKDIQSEFGPDIFDEMVEEMVDRMYYFEITKKYCGKILDKAKPKLIIELCYYAMECYALSALGKERGIPTAEYSHGFAFPTHTPMQYNSEDNSSVLPDYELIYSRTQESIVHLPSQVKMITVGFPFFERERERYQKQFPKDSKTICVMSTQVEGVDISKIAMELADKLKGQYKVILKLHPQEFAYYKDRYPWLKGSNLEIIDTLDNHVYRYLAEADICISTCSATVWEGIGFGCKPVLLNIGNTEKNMNYLISEKNVPLCNNADEIISLINQDSIPRLDPDFIFEPHAMENICKFIDQFTK